MYHHVRMRFILIYSGRFKAPDLIAEATIVCLIQMASAHKLRYEISKGFGAVVMVQKSNNILPTLKC